MPTTQTFKNHTRFDPGFHFFLAPILLVDIGFAIYTTIHHWPDHPHLNPWWIVMSVALLVLAGTARRYALANQDRMIRMEERLRYASVLTPATLQKSHALTLKQIVSLRFASDPELPALLERTLSENLAPKQIKQSIVTWRPDYERV